MSYPTPKLKSIFARTNGHCHICHGRLVFSKYGQSETNGAWEVEHSVAKANGGTCHGNNLFAAHTTCNRQKGVLTSRSARRRFAQTRAPWSAEKHKKKVTENGVTGACLLGAAGLAGGPIGVAILGTLGYALGSALTPTK